jgi:hypothetical protein
MTKQIKRRSNSAHYHHFGLAGHFNADVLFVATSSRQPYSFRKVDYNCRKSLCPQAFIDINERRMLSDVGL